MAASKLYLRKKKSGAIFMKKPELSSDGLLLEVVNSMPSAQTCIGGCQQKSEVIFIQTAVNPEGEVVLLGDVHGNIFTLDLIKNKFNLIKHLSMPSSCLSVSLKKKHDCMVALSDYSIRIFDSEFQKQLAVLKGHESSISNISIHSSKRYALSTSSDTAFLWNLDTYDRKRKLSISKDVDLLLACFIPNTNSIMTCFKDNSILVWDAESMELLHELKSSQAYDVNYRVFACNPDGSCIAAGGKSNFIHIWNVANRRILKVLQLPAETTSVRQIEYIPRYMYPEELIAVICSNGVLRVIDIKNSTELLAVGSYEHKVIQMSVAEISGTFVCLMDSGNVNIYDMERILKSILAEQKLADKKCEVEEESKSSRSHVKTQRVQRSGRMKEVINQKIENSKTLNNEKLREILKEYGEFPERYRTFIWKTILRLPENYQAYSALLEKGIHPAFVDIHKIYPIRSMKLLRIFQRLLSAVAYWAPVAVETPFIPTIAFPFAKLLQNNQLIAFEVVATVLLNWCQKWFDFIPNPPLNILAMIENVLSYHDRELFQHFIKYRVTTQVYAWSLLQSGFSEVFSRNEWMKIWDHILINQPSWMLMAVVAYTLVNRGPLLECYELEEFKQFYRHHNGTGVGIVIKEAYKIIRTTPAELDPQNNLSFFTPLLEGQYQLLAKFPQRVKDFPQNEIDRIRREQIELLKSDDMVVWSKR